MHHANLGLDLGQSSPHDVTHWQLGRLTYPWAMHAEETKCCQSLAVFRMTGWLNGLEPMISHAVTQIEAPFLKTLHLNPFQELFDLLSDGGQLTWPDLWRKIWYHGIRIYAWHIVAIQGSLRKQRLCSKIVSSNVNFGTVWRNKCPAWPCLWTHSLFQAFSRLYVLVVVTANHVLF